MRRLILVVADAAILVLAAFLSVLLRFDGFAVPGGNFEVFVRLLPLLIVGNLAVFAAFGLYNRLWQYASVADAFAVVTAVSLAGAGNTLLLLWVGNGFPRSIPVIMWALSLIGVGVVRFWGRLRRDLALPRSRALQRRRQALILGAGHLGRLLLSDLRFIAPDVNVVGIVDDDPSKIGYRMHGVRVVGRTADLRDLCGRLGVTDLLVAARGVDPRLTQQLLRELQPLGVKLSRTEISVSDRRLALHEIDVQDLLHRPPVNLLSEHLQVFFQGQTVLVTGAGGSIGSEICRQVATFSPARLIALGHGENSIHHLTESLREAHPDLDLTRVIADVRDESRMVDVLDFFKPDIVFHAAAHKHVYLMQENPQEAVTNNVFGTATTLTAAAKAGCSCFVLISTDKAVSPSSVMGATKRMAENIVVSASGRWQMRSLAVRFGNVLGSRGSVVPTFEEQIRKGGPVTVTHPDMKRYFMTIPEASQLVLEAARIGESGSIYVLDMGEPVRIVDLAEDMIRIHGYEPGRDIALTFTGAKPGERLEEQLVDPGDTLEATEHPKIRRLRRTSTTPADFPQLAESLLETAVTSSWVSKANTVLEPFLPELEK